MKPRKTLVSEFDVMAVAFYEGDPITESILINNGLFNYEGKQFTNLYIHPVFKEEELSVLFLYLENASGIDEWTGKTVLEDLMDTYRDYIRNECMKFLNKEEE